MTNAMKRALNTKIVYVSRLSLQEIQQLQASGFTVILTSPTPAPSLNCASSGPWIRPVAIDIRQALRMPAALIEPPKVCKVQHALEGRMWR